MKFKEGDLVVLNSGGPTMTVSHYDYGEVYCKWFDKQHLEHISNFTEGSIKIYEPVVLPEMKVYSS